MTQQGGDVGLGNAGDIERCGEVLAERMESHPVSDHSTTAPINCEALCEVRTKFPVGSSLLQSREQRTFWNTF